MPVTAGTRLGPYEIVSPIGAGGMGEVYRATDTRLGRDVAVKVASATFSDRFEREARAVAALNHPHICTIHDVGPNYLVMELIEGDTLADRIARGPLPLADAVRIAGEIAEALEAAHEKGIVHRDLKPGNIKIKPDGSVKVLDFGLAKTLMAPEGAALSNSPTFAMGATQEGVILGTAAYMSPEQARGLAVDKRSDVWAFGCVLFEMLAGKRAFGGETVTDALAGILKSDPDWRALPAGTPRLLTSVLRRCLQKDASARLRDLGDARLEIQEAIDERDLAAAAPASDARSRWTAVVPWGICAALALAVAWLLFGSARGPAASDHQVTRLELDLPFGVEPYVGGAQAIAFSPDGTRAAFVGIVEGNRQIYIRRMAEGVAAPLKGTEGATAVFFAPNGRSVGAILTSGALVRISLDDGLVTPLLRNADINAGATWDVNDRITFGRAGVLWQMPSAGGAPTQITTLDAAKGELLHSSPFALPSGRAMLFVVMTGAGRGASHIETLSLSDRRRQIVIDQGNAPVYARSGHLIFFRDTSLFTVPFDADRLQVNGTAVRTIDAVRVNAIGSAVVAISETGSMMYMGLTSASRLVWVSRLGVDVPFGDATGPYTFPSLSRDGRRIVVSADGEVWVGDTQRGVLTRVTSGTTSGNSFPVITPDGKRAVFRTRTGLFTIDAEGSGRSVFLPGTTTIDYPTSVSPDGKTLAFLRIGGDNSGDVYVTALDGSSTPRPLINTAAYEGGGTFSPDGRWIAYASDESEHFQVFVRLLANPERKWLVAQAGKYPRWNQNGKEIFYRDGNKMMAVDVSMSGEEPVIGTPHVLFEQRFEFGLGQTTANYDVTPDGQRFLMVKGDTGWNRLNVVLGAFDELRRLAPAGR